MSKKVVFLFFIITLAALTFFIKKNVNNGFKTISSFFITSTPSAQESAATPVSDSDSEENDTNDCNPDSKNSESEKDSKDSKEDNTDSDEDVAIVYHEFFLTPFQNSETNFCDLNSETVSTIVEILSPPPQA